ncbi:MAG TPA: hypothetical protein PLP69_00040 [Bacteroidales bacterium]|nr:hypothetical protein [Bacteroidales bacterium]
MKRFLLRYGIRVQAAAMAILLLSCGKLADYRQAPELESLQQGIRTSAAIGYCASIVTSAFKGEALPDNVSFNKSSGLIHITIDEAHPLPFNTNDGEIVIACLWSGDGGVMSILLGNLDLPGGKAKLTGFYTVPIISADDKKIQTLFAREDIIIGSGADTLLNLSTVTLPVFNAELNRLNTTMPSDVFVAVKQNVWFINVDRNNTVSDPYDDYVTVTGGGQIAEAQGASGGVIYHALIDAKLNYSICDKNPVNGHALTQNFKAGGEPYIDLGNSYLSFHQNCDGKAHIELSTGKYIWYNNTDIDLNIW